MYEKNERDFSIHYNEDRNNFSLWVGTWSNDNQNFADVIFYLSLTKDLKDTFLVELNKYNDLFIDNKDNIIKDINKNGFNMLNTILNESDIDDILSEQTHSDTQEGIIADDKYYNFDYPKAETFLESYKDDIIKIIQDSKNIKEVYEGLQKLKIEMREAVYNDFFDYTFLE